MKTVFFNKISHVEDLISNPYYRNLLYLRNALTIACDEYFQKLKAIKVDLYLITQGVSSPMGKGSDSKPIPFIFGNNKAYLVDSAQFGMEPLVFNMYKIVYCYLPSFRGEDPDYRHLNQFYHCEAEMRGEYRKIIEIVNDLINHLVCCVVDQARSNKLKIYGKKSKDYLKKLDYICGKKYPIVTFDEAFKLLTNNGYGNLVKQTEFGRVLSHDGEIKITELISQNKLPVWVTKYDRDTVAFYQKPDPENPERVLNADLLFPPLNGGFGGEIIGSGQRQDNFKELMESIKRQEIKDYRCYSWYINLRKHKKYTTTSGFGMGIERLIAWMLGLHSIIDAITYPVLKDVHCL